MKLDTKQKVLVALYIEYQKDLPDMKKIDADALGIEKDVFYVAIDKLRHENLIKDVNVIKSGKTAIPQMVWLNDAKVTPYGLNYVEEKLGIEPNLSGYEKVSKTTKKLSEWGLEQFKDIIAKIGAEYLKGTV